MLTAAAISHQPIVKFSLPFSSRNSPRALSAYPEITISKLAFGSKKSLFEGSTLWGGRKRLFEFMTSNAFRETDGQHEGLPILELEQEVAADGPLGLWAGVAAGGFEPTLNKLSKWLVAGLFGAIILLRHDSEAVWAAMGSVLNAGLSNVLKQILNQERPVVNLRSDPGMPSSHAQSIFFIVVFAIVSMVELIGLGALTSSLSVVVLAFGSYLTWLRVSQKLHTISQVLVGALMGSLFSALWFWSWDAFVLEAFDSSILVRITVILGAVAFCLGFIIYVFQNWLKAEERLSASLLMLQISLSLNLGKRKISLAPEEMFSTT